MIRICRMLFLFTVLMFVFVQVGICASPVTIKGAQITPKTPLNKMRIKPNLSVIAMQFANTQELEVVRYQIKVKNRSTHPYPGGAVLIVELQKFYQAGNTTVWNVAETGIKIDPIGPGKEVILRGTVQRSGNTSHFKAVIKAGNSIITTYAKPLPPMPVPDIRITGVKCEGDHLLFSIENKSNYETKAILQYYYGRMKVNGSVDYSPGPGSGILILTPHKIAHCRTRVIPQDVSLVQAVVFLSRLTTIRVAERVANPNNCGQ